MQNKKKSKSIKKKGKQHNQKGGGQGNKFSKNGTYTLMQSLPAKSQRTLSRRRR
jgi:hypothetical protein